MNILSLILLILIYEVLPTTGTFESLFCVKAMGKGWSTLNKES